MYYIKFLQTPKVCGSESVNMNYFVFLKIYYSTVLLVITFADHDITYFKLGSPERLVVTEALPKHNVTRCIFYKPDNK